jgi:Tol biopolymer transport system component
MGTRISIRSVAAFTLTVAATTPLALASQADTARAGASRRPDLGPLKTIDFETDEGTYLSLDLSPDGRQIAFDLLGDIYLLPIEGGDARALTTGLAWDQQPRWSPDGRRIAFVSDRDGGSNLWIMNADGTQPRQLSRGRKDTFISPAWLPDGPAIMVRMNQWGGAGAPGQPGASDLYVYYPEGGFMRLAEGKLTGAANAVASPDGRYIYYPGQGTFAFGGAGPINRFDRVTGTNIPLTWSGRNLRPAASPDGKLLAFLRKVDERLDLRLRDLTTGAERVLVPALWPEEIGNSGNQGDYPSYGFTPDSRAIVIWARGKIHRVDVATGAATVIPMRVRVSLQVAERIAKPRRLTSDSVSSRIVRWPRVSPDGRRLVFSSLAKLWVMDLPNGRPRRLTNADEGEYAPAISPDGRAVTYTTWRDSLVGGHLKVVPIDGGTSRSVTTLPGQYLNPSWSPDGSKIAYVVGSPISEQIAWQPDETMPYAVRWIEAAGGESRLLTHIPVPNWPEHSHTTLTWSADGARLYFTEMVTGGRAKRTLVSMRLDGSDKQVHLRFNPGDEAAVSPDGGRVAITRGDNVYVTQLPVYTPTTIDYTFEGGPFPTIRLTRDGGDFPAWLDAQTLVWGNGTRVHRRRFAGAQITPGDTATAPDLVAEVRLVVPRAIPGGSIAFTNARIVTMRGGREEVTSGATIVVTGDRITAIGRGVRVPPGAQVVNAAGTTIIPGLHDSHAHVQFNPHGTYPEQKWPFIVNLAYGVTSFMDPWNPSHEIFEQGDMADAGLLLSPRIFSTGSWIDGRREELPQFIDIRTIDDARSIVRRLKTLGADMLKEYIQPRREARQFLAQAAREEGVPLTAEGGGDWVRNFGMVMDGFSAFEHTLPIAPLYKDAIELLARTGVYYTPTLMVTYGGEALNNYYYGETNPHDDPKVRRFTPEERMDEGRRWVKVPEQELFFKQISRDLIKITRAGGKVALGAHGNRQGIGVHWELWGKVAGGATPWEALRDATWTPAEKLGLERDLGSLEVGKLADFVVLSRDPLANIRNSDAIRWVVKGGVVYDGNSMATLWPERKSLERFFWQTEADYQRFKAAEPTPIGRRLLSGR